jgi:hypothetical protein
MEINIVTKEDGRVKKIFKQLEQIRNQITTIEANNRSLFNGERYLTDVDLSTKLSVSRRTTQEWRSNGIVGYILLGGKSLYRESEIEKLLRNNYYAPFKERRFF